MTISHLKIFQVPCFLNKVVTKIFIFMQHEI